MEEILDRDGIVLDKNIIAGHLERTYIIGSDGVIAAYYLDVKVDDRSIRLTYDPYSDRVLTYSSGIIIGGGTEYNNDTKVITDYL